MPRISHDYPTGTIKLCSARMFLSASLIPSSKSPSIQKYLFASSARNTTVLSIIVWNILYILKTQDLNTSQKESGGCHLTAPCILVACF